MASSKDYYKILGVEKSADEKTIKAAFRKKAKESHPDANPNNPNAEARFKEVNEAYEVLSDPDKRSMYDRFGTANPQGIPTGGRYPGGNTDFGEAGSFGDLFESIFGGFSRTSTRGRGNVQEGAFRTNVRPKGQDIEQPVTISLREAYAGATRIINIGGRRLEARIPVGATNGTRVRLSGEGSPGFSGGPAGDLYLIIEVEPDDQFERDGKTEVKVDMFTALLGGEVEVPTLERTVKLRIPPGTQSGRRFRLTGKGMPILNNKAMTGDLYARILVMVPENLTAEQRQLVERLRDSLR
jgi:curved DNA-binding protein